MVDEGALRMVTALGHGVPGVTLRVSCLHGEELVVAANRLDAHLDPCQLRAAVLGRIAEARAGRGEPRLSTWLGEEMRRAAAAAVRRAA